MSITRSAVGGIGLLICDLTRLGLAVAGGRAWVDHARAPCWQWHRQGKDCREIGVADEAFREVLVGG